VRLCPNIDVVASVTASERILAHFMFAPMFRTPDVDRLLLTHFRGQGFRGQTTIELQKKHGESPRAERPTCHKLTVVVYP
jgi:hypothetical protein